MLLYRRQSDATAAGDGSDVDWSSAKYENIGLENIGVELDRRAIR